MRTWTLEDVIVGAVERSVQAAAELASIPRNAALLASPVAARLLVPSLSIDVHSAVTVEEGRLRLFTRRRGERSAMQLSLSAAIDSQPRASAGDPAPTVVHRARWRRLSALAGAIVLTLDPPDGTLAPSSESRPARGRRLVIRFPNDAADVTWTLETAVGIEGFWNSKKRPVEDPPCALLAALVATLARAVEETADALAPITAGSTPLPFEAQVLEGLDAIERAVDGPMVDDGSVDGGGYRLSAATATLVNFERREVAAGRSRSLPRWIELRASFEPPRAMITVLPAGILAPDRGRDLIESASRRPLHAGSTRRQSLPAARRLLDAALTPGGEPRATPGAPLTPAPGEPPTAPLPIVAVSMGDEHDGAHRVLALIRGAPSAEDDADQVLLELLLAGPPDPAERPFVTRTRVLGRRLTAGGAWMPLRPDDAGGASEASEAIIAWSISISHALRACTSGP